MGRPSTNEEIDKAFFPATPYEISVFSFLFDMGSCKSDKRMKKDQISYVRGHHGKSSKQKLPSCLITQLKLISHVSCSFHQVVSHFVWLCISHSILDCPGIYMIICNIINNVEDCLDNCLILFIDQQLLWLSMCIQTLGFVLQDFAIV